MTATSIRHMHLTVALQEQLAEDREKSQPKSDTQHYWHIQRKSKRGNRWIFVAEFFGTKADVADYWRKTYQHKNKPVRFRLQHLFKYS